MVRQIFNEIIKQNEFTPEAWKKVKIKVIFKKGDVENVGNYRPICSLPVLYKLFSTILHKRLYPALDQKQAEDQAGFRNLYQTTDHLATYRMIEQKCHEWGIKMWTATVDFTKAFSTPLHTNHFGKPSNLATSNTTTSASRRRYTETRKHLYWLTKKVTRLRSRKEPNRVTHCQACCFNTVLQQALDEDILPWQKKKRNGNFLE